MNEKSEMYTSRTFALRNGPPPVRNLDTQELRQLAPQQLTPRPVPLKHHRRAMHARPELDFVRLDYRLKWVPRLGPEPAHMRVEVLHPGEAQRGDAAPLRRARLREHLRACAPYARRLRLLDVLHRSEAPPEVLERECLPRAVLPLEALHEVFFHVYAREEGGGEEGGLADEPREVDYTY